jgi:predicted GIY-YIG superfamily endonuclease
MDTSSSSPHYASLQSLQQHGNPEAKEDEIKPLQKQKLPGPLQSVLEHIGLLKFPSRLRDNEFQCVASVLRLPHTRCTNSRPSAPAWIFKKLAECSTDTTYSEFLYHFGGLVQAVMCGLHRNVLLSKYIATIVRLFPSQSHLSNKDCLYLRSWIDPHHTKWSKTSLVPEALREAVMRPLRPSNQRDGFLYILYDRHSGTVKIGSTMDIARRVREWEMRCKRKYLLSSSLGQHIITPHCRLIESLICIELKEYRIKDACEGCDCIHTEWFAVDEVLAVKVLQKWQNWIAQKPYVLNNVSGRWGFRPETLHTLPHPIHVS